MEKYLKQDQFYVSVAKTTEYLGLTFKLRVDKVDKEDLPFKRTSRVLFISTF